jgi:hypothetical protein
MRALLKKYEDKWFDRHPDLLDPENSEAALREALAQARVALIEQDERARVAKIEAEAAAARKEAERLAAAEREKVEAEAEAEQRKIEAEAEALRQKVEEARRHAEADALIAQRAAEAKAQALREAKAAARRFEAAYPRGRRFADEHPSMPLNDQLREGRILYGASLASKDDSRVSFALGIFERRRGRRAWRQEWARGKYGIPIWQ